MNRSARLRAVRSLLALLIVAGITVFFRDALPRVNQTTVALSFLLAILAVSAVWGMTVSVLMSIAAILALNYFFLPPVGTLTVADPENWVALSCRRDDDSWRRQSPRVLNLCGEISNSPNRCPAHERRKEKVKKEDRHRT